MTLAQAFTVAIAAVLTLLGAIYERLRACFIPPVRAKDRQRVAVIGGGIAGFGAAHSLCSSGFSVDIYEKEKEVGGNAKTFEWPDGVITGLSVLAWPNDYFRNYGALLRQLKIPTTMVDLNFFIRRADGVSFVHGRSEGLRMTYAADFRRWARLVALVRACNSFFSRSTTPSLYHLSLLNPMNVMPLRLLCFLCGVSSGFFHDVVVPMHITTFLSNRLAFVPAVVVPTVDDLIPLEGTPTLQSWRGSSREVFEGIASRAGGRMKVRTGSAVEHVRQEADGSWTVHVRRSDRPTVAHEGYDRIVFASNARHASKALELCAPSWWGARMLLGSVQHADEQCEMFRTGLIHSDATVLPPDAREEILSRCCNYIEARSDDASVSSGPPTFENTFVLSSWYPSATESDGRVRLVSYGLREPEKLNHVLGQVVNETNHPELSPTFLASAMLLRMLQGQRGVYFCGSMATPGNGHDLSLCSGLAVAAAIGAKYPFEGEREAEEDLGRLRSILGL
jgi:predicted NAD/FAD-binding protein